MRMQDDAPSVERDGLTRATLLRRAAAAGVVLAAGADARIAWARPEAAHAGGTINFFSWQGYDLLPETKAWRARHHITIHSTYVSAHSDITAKFTTGGGKGLYNLSTYNAGYGQFYHRLGILTPLDLSKIPNYKHVFPFFKSGAAYNHWWHFGGKQWGIPWTWGAEGINYDRTKVPAPKTYKALLDPSLKGKIAVMDDMRGAIHIGALVLGIANVNSYYTKSQLNDILGFWGKVKANARSIAPSYGDLAEQFVSGEIVAAAPGWAAVNGFAAAKGDSNVKHVIPREGGYAYCDTWFIPPDSKDTDAVYAFINESLAPRVQAQGAIALDAGVVAPKAVSMLDKTTRDYYPYASLAAFLRRVTLPGVPYTAPKGYVTYSDMQTAWEAFKA